MECWARFVLFLKILLAFGSKMQHMKWHFTFRKPMWNHFVPRQKCDMKKGPFFYARKEFKTVTAAATTTTVKITFIRKPPSYNFFSLPRYKLSNAFNITSCQKCQEFMRKYQMFSFVFFILSLHIYGYLVVCFVKLLKRWNSIFVSLHRSNSNKVGTGKWL